MSQIEISPEQRDALYRAITARLTGLNDVFSEFEHGNFDAAHRLSGEFSDDLRVLHDDLGWGDPALATIQLRAPRDVWERTLTRIRRRAAEESREKEQIALELETERKRIQMIEDTCESLASRFQIETTTDVDPRRQG
jgi:hypothetical protein